MIRLPLWFVLLGAVSGAVSAGLAQSMPPPTAVGQWEGPVTSIALLDGELLIAAQDQVVVFDMEKLQTVRTAKMPVGQVTQLVPAAGGNRAFVAGGDPGRSGQVLEISLADLKILRRFDVHSDTVTGLAFSPDGGRIALASVDGLCSLLDPVGGASTEFAGHTRGATGSAWIRGNHWATVAEDMSVRVWNATAPGPVRTMNQHTGRVLGVRTLEGAESAEPVIATWGEDRTVRIWQPLAGRMVRFVRLPAVPASLIFDPALQQLIVGDQSGNLHWIDWKTCRLLETRGVAAGWLVSLCAGGGSIWVGTDAGELFRLEAGRE